MSRGSVIFCRIIGIITGLGLGLALAFLFFYFVYVFYSFLGVNLCGSF